MNELDDSRIGDDQSVWAEFASFEERLLEWSDLGVARNDVACQMETLALGMADFDALGEIVQGAETVFTGAKRECRLPSIDRICTVGERVFHAF